ncbi:MAG: hypothetical protein IJ789_00195 [Bacteroidales bacterium]|nr:hypothetical protein [Bacteroidales bacterium]
MLDHESTLASIEAKLRQLGDQAALDGNTAAEARDARIALENTINEQNITINNLKEENKLLKQQCDESARRGDTADIKLRINQLIRIIDNSLNELEQD